MKIKYMSDLHLEFGPLTEPMRDYDCDVLVLAGDIHVGPVNVANFLNTLFNFEHIVYVPGNHEYYGQEYWDFYDILNNQLKAANVNILDHMYGFNSVKINDVTFIGDTLWSKANYLSWYKINDSRKIKVNGKHFSLESVVGTHNFAKQEILEEAKKAKTDKVVMVTHHAPSFESMLEAKKRYPDADIMGPSYASQIIHEFEGLVDIWIHGHT